MTACHKAGTYSLMPPNNVGVHLSQRESFGVKLSAGREGLTICPGKMLAPNSGN